MLKYWKNNAFRSPILSNVARKYLAIPATSASIKRGFSITSNIITKKRNKLSPETVRALILLTSWKLMGLKDLSINSDEDLQTENEGE